MKTSVKAYGDKSVLLELSEFRSHEVLSSLKKLFPEAEVRAGMESVLISFESAGNYTSEVLGKLEDLELNKVETTAKQLVVPVEYNGEDLDLVAKTLGLSRPEVIALHQSITWNVALIGFAPGFPYLLPDKATVLDKIARLDSPRSKVPAGSVALAAGMSCIYPKSMPGGWHLIGTTSLQLFDSDNEVQPTLLSVGDIVRFTSL